jgi:hypothetical protein
LWFFCNKLVYKFGGAASSTGRTSRGSGGAQVPMWIQHRE